MPNKMDEWWSRWSACLITALIYLQITYAQFTAGNHKLKRFVFDAETNRIYIGAVNRIFMLDNNFATIQNVTTGPKLDNNECPFLGETREGECLSNGKPLTETDNHNKILVLDKANNNLLTCGSVLQGTCEKRSLDTAQEIETFYRYTPQKVLAPATDDDEYETAAFIAQGPQCSDTGRFEGVQDVLYTALSLFYVDGRLNDPVFTFLSSHQLTASNYLEYAGEDFLTGEGTHTYFMTIDKHATRNIVRSGFAAGKFRYVTFLSQFNSDDVTSKIAQVCRDDCNYNSYVEIPIQCTSSQKQYNLIQTAKLARPGSQLARELGISTSEDILVAVFREGASVTQYGTDSAVCVYTMRYIRNMFTQNIQACHNGEYTSVGENFADSFKSKPCVQTNTWINDTYCDADDTNSPLSGQEAAVKAPFLTFPNTHLTSVAVDVIGQHTVAFLGTSDGVLKKAELLDGKDVYDETTMEAGQPIKPDMVLIEDSSQLLLMTPNKLYKLPTSDCGQADSCSECKELNDPYCGWCSLETKCSRREECRNSQLDNRWISYGGWCVSLQSVTPDRASIPRGVTMVEVRVNSLPELTNANTYNCVFGPDTVVGTKSDSRIKCPSPMTTLNPSGDSGFSGDHRVVDFYIQSSETNHNFLQSTFTYYDCTVHDRCSSCAGASWNCRWCVYENSCRDEFSTCEENTDVRRESNCPRITHTSEILVPFGVPTEIRIDAENLVQPLGNQAGYECAIHLGEPAKRVPARVEPDGRSVVCQQDTYTYPLKTEKEEPSISIYWNNNFLVERIGNSLNAEVFRCDIMGRDCSECLSLDERNNYVKYDCGYCSSAGECVYSPTCSEAPQTECPAPEITSIEPLNGPVEGGTRINITGSNLGTNMLAVEDAVKVGQKTCRVVHYEVSRMISCIVQSGNAGDAPITVTINAHTQNYGRPFQYRDPYIEASFPTYGPKSGGTLLTITGSQLKTGNTISVLIGEETCTIEEIEDTKITCKTGSVTSPVSNLEINLTFDAANRFVRTQRYTYRNDPKIILVEPLRTFLSGGRIITVTGTDLDVVQTPRMFIHYENERKQSDCKNVTSEQLLCPTPSLEDPVDEEEEDPENQRKKRQAPDPPSYVLEFEFDAVENYFWNNSNGQLFMEVVENPVFYKFANGRKTYAVDSDSSLEIEGERINAAATANEITVMIGQDVCVVKTVSEDRLYCTPPNKDESEDGVTARHPVVVTVGNYEETLGDLMYQFKKSTRNDIWIIIVAVGGGILLSIIIIISIVYKRKKTQADRQYKKLKMQLDTLESNVRNECKQAFAELQTEVSDFTSDISVIGIPYWDYKTYTFKVLFPSHTDHPVLHNSPDYKVNKFGSYDQGLHQFSQLLNSKQFMLIFIRTLEQQKNFSIRDKAVVASLLMIVLQDKMEYATEILKSLLEELIDRSVEKKHPKLMLRRTESVVEKLLTNWLSIAMYGYVKKQSGKPLFMLYQAIKRQTEKGPVDAISSEARYSLSEDRLLREKIEPKTLTINLVQDGQKEPVTCKCLDCDTITQAKQKALDAIYLNMPFCNRPSVHDVDLEWRSGKTGHLPLQDEDVTTEVVHGWKKVNTLAHYHVPDGAVMALVSKRHKTEGVRQVHGRIEITAGSGLSGIQPIITMEEGQKVWHLVKHDDGIYISRSQKVISEIFLTRLLATKGTLQQYIDDLFRTILSVDNSIPPAIKWLFDLLDAAAKKHNILDPDVVHTWKSNSLPLRFWVNIIKNPDFVFDINKSHICDSCLSVIAQTFMDACSTTDHKLGKDSPSNKLLFAKDIPRYRGWVSKFYKGIQDMAPVTDADINEIMTEMSLHYTADFNVSIALKELFKYAHQYNFELLENLDEDPSARKLHLANMFEQVTAALDVGTMFRS